MRDTAGNVGKAVEARIKSRGGFWFKRKGGIGKGNLFETTLLEESSEGESPGVLGAERGFRGLMELTPSRG